MNKEKSLAPFFVCFAVLIMSIVFPALLLRDLSAWVILLALAPFGVLQLLGLWVLVDAFTRGKSRDMTQG